jgi:hypothetical protein
MMRFFMTSPIPQQIIRASNLPDSIWQMANCTEPKTSSHFPYQCHPKSAR